MYRIALSLVTLTLALSAQLTSSTANTQSAVGLNPTVTFEGGSPAERNTVIGAVARYGDAGLGLPDLKIRIHADRSGCDHKQGLFGVSNGEGIIDLCFDREFLALHELGHAWVHFNLEDRARETFLRLTEALSWTGSETSWHRRGSEVAANALAHGLLSDPLASSQQRTREFAQFQALTGRPSPRLTEVEPIHNPNPDFSADELAALAAYSEARSARATETTSTIPVTQDPLPASTRGLRLGSLQ